MKIWILEDFEGELRDVWRERHMTLAEAVVFTHFTLVEDIELWTRPSFDSDPSKWEGAIGTREEVDEFWPDRKHTVYKEQRKKRS